MLEQEIEVIKRENILKPLAVGNLLQQESGSCL